MKSRGDTLCFGSKDKLVNHETVAARRNGHEKVTKLDWACWEDHHGERQESTNMAQEIQFEDQQGTENFECIMCDGWNYKRNTIKTMKKHVYMTRAELEGLA